MNIQKKPKLNSNLDFVTKLLPLNFILFYLLPSLLFGKFIINLNTFILIKLFFLYVFCLSIPLLFLYLAICTSIILGDIFLHNKLKRFLDYYL